MATLTRVVNGVEVPGCVVKEIEKKLYKTLKDVFGYDSYRSLVQKRAVEAVANSSQDVFVSMPTGAGKSLCYQLPALVSERPGVTLVVSPLIALMTNQIENMKSIGISTETINSKMTASERERVKTDLMSPTPKVKLLYITPELANTPGFHLLIDHLFNNDNIARIVVDEAHCVSQWGHSFRPDYLRLGFLREKYMTVPWVALTATASVQVMDDILLQLKMCQPVAIFKSSCFRPNLFYDVVFKETLDDPYDDLKEFAYSALGEHWEMTPPSERGCGIVYCRTRDACEEIATRLTRLGLRTQAYHAGLKTDLRKEIQTNWMEGRTPVIAATVSFGMGIDKRTVRFVAHWCVSQSLAGYYQESGRAGRDTEPARCRIYYSSRDRDTIYFLLKKDEGKSKSKMAKVKASVAIKSFTSTVKYCEELNCRHYLLSREFGDDIPDCKKHCDCCFIPKKVEHKLQLFRSVRLGTKTEPRGSSKVSSEELYGGGRKGAKEENEAYDFESQTAEEREQKARKELSAFINKEFEKRRNVKAAEKHIETSSKVLEPSLKKIVGLSVEAREKYFDKLVYELNVHLRACETNPECPKLSASDVKNCAAEYELSASKTKGNIHVYRRDFVQLFKSLQEASRQVEVHPILSKHISKPEAKTKAVQKERLYDILDMVSRHTMVNDNSRSALFFSSSQSCTDSHRTDGGSSRYSDAYLVDDVRRRCETLSADSTHSEHEFDERQVSSSSCESSPDEGARRKRRKSSNVSDSSKSAITNKPMIKYFFERVTPNYHEKISPGQSSSVSSPVSPVTSDKNEACTSNTSLVPSKRPCVAKDKAHSPKKHKSEPILKQTTLEKPKKEALKTTSQIQNDNLKKAADLVRKHLNPQYKAKKISKDLFKIVCRSISHRLVEAGAVNDRAAKLEVEKLFQQYSVLQNSSVEAAS